jgi:ATP-dependent helicase/nuclease subunit A
MIEGLTVNGTQVEDYVFYQTALNPHGSVVVEACAGSGKTWMLAARVMRLLLAGASPSAIVAITFTNKAAAEMRSRIYGWLSDMALIDDAALLQMLRNFYVAETDLPTVALRARKLALEVLTAANSLSIHTFHAWFLRLKSALPISDSAALFASVNASPAMLEMDAWQRFLNQLVSDACFAKNLCSFCWGVRAGKRPKNFANIY